MLRVDTFEIRDEEGDLIEYKIHLFAEIDGFHYDSDDYDSLEEFLQAIVNYGYDNGKRGL